MHYRSVFALCLGMLGNVHDAEDIAQEAILKGLENLDKLYKNELSGTCPEPVRFRAWIMRIAKNLCIDFLRRKKSMKEIITRQNNPRVIEKNENHDLQHAIKQLPYELRLPLTMYYFEKKNAKLIAEILEMSHSNACQKIRQARQMLHEILTERVEK